MTKFHLDQSLPARKPPINDDGTDANGRIGLDTMRRVTRDEALELMCHHISIAAMYYEATQDDEAAVLRECERVLDSGIENYSGRDVVAVRAFLSTMNKFYGDLKEEQVPHRKIKVRIKSTGNNGFLHSTIEELKAKGIQRTLVYYELTTGAGAARQIDLDDLEEINDQI